VLELRRNEIAAVRVGGRRHRLGLERAQRVALALAHIGVERALVLARGSVGDAGAGAVEGGTRALERQFVDAALLGVERVVDAPELLLGQHVGAAAAREQFVVGGLELLEHLQEAVVAVARGGTGCRTCAPARRRECRSQSSSSGSPG